MTTPDWKAKIVALLAKASGTDNIDESRAYQEKAAYLMNKFSIEESMLRMKEHSDEKPVFEIFKKFKPYEISKAELLSVVAQCLGGNTVNIQDGPEIYVFGFVGDLERIKLMYFSLLAQMHIESSELIIPQSENKRAYTTSWLRGFIYGVRKRMTRAYGKANSETNAMVLYDRESKVRDAMQEKFADLKQRGPRKVSDARAFAHGVQSGLAADVGQDRLGKSAGRKAIES